jgi:hypothetical protein
VKKKILFPLLVLVAGMASAQTKIKDGTVAGPVTPNAAAILELESNNKGLLLSKVELTNTTTWGLAGSQVSGMLVYNTLAAITGTNPAYPVLSGGVGVYYWDGTGWVGVKSGAGPVSTEPWFDQATNAGATANTQNIYQMGNVGVKTNTPLTSLDVRGPIRGGNPHLTGAIGNNSFATGSLNVASGESSAAFGGETVASGLHATAFGFQSTASGRLSTTFGSNNLAQGSRAFAAGTLNKALGDYAVVFGGGNEVRGFHAASFGVNNVNESNFEFVAGTNNLFTTGQSSLFQIGNANPNTPAVRSNAVSVMKDGKVGVGTHTVAPNSTFQVFGSVSANVRVVTAGGTLAEDDYTIISRATSAITLTLPDPATCKGRMYYIINNGSQPITTSLSFEVSTGNTQNTIPVAGVGIGFPTPNFGNKYLLQSDGSTWVLISLG